MKENQVEESIVLFIKENPPSDKSEKLTMLKRQNPCSLKFQIKWEKYSPKTVLLFTWRQWWQTGMCQKAMRAGNTI